MKSTVDGYNFCPHTSTGKRPVYLFTTRDLPEDIVQKVNNKQAQKQTEDGAGLYRYPQTLKDFVPYTPILTEKTKDEEMEEGREWLDKESLYLTCYAHLKKHLYPITDADKRKVKRKLLRSLTIRKEYTSNKNGQQYYKVLIKGVGLRDIRKDDNLIVSDRMNTK